MEFVFLISGLIIGIVSAYMILKSRGDSSSKIYEERSLMLESNFTASQKELSLEREKVIKLNSDLSRTEAEYKNLKVKLDEQKEDIEKLHQKFTTEFKNLANEILDDKSKKFTEQNKDNLDSILKPLGEKIKDFEKRVEETYDRESKQRFSLEREIKNLYDLNQLMTKEAVNLTNALKGQVKTQGNWGEFILETILEKSGLQKDREYIIQASLKTDDGKRLQPDVLINLPDNKTIIIDAKVSLIAYELYCSSDDEEIKRSSLKDHIASLRSHLKGLTSKNYQNIYEIKSLDFVLMFLPIEPAFALALQHDNNIFNEAFEKNIIIVSPTNLLATLRTIANIWKQEHQNRNALEIAKKSGALYDKFEGLVSDLIELGKRFRQAHDHYDDSMKKLYSGRGNIISQIENIKKLGAKTTKSLPNTLLERAEFTDDEDNEHNESNDGDGLKLL
jgi:DNA recombination protein RmuC